MKPFIATFIDNYNFSSNENIKIIFKYFGSPKNRVNERLQKY